MKHKIIIILSLTLIAFQGDLHCFSDDQEEFSIEKKLHIVKTPYEFPYIPNGKLIINFKDIFSAIGSGVLISPCYVLTSAYNLYNREFKKIPTKIEFFLLDGKIKSQAEYVRISPNFIFPESEEEEELASIALIRLKDSPGDDIGYLGIKRKAISDTKASIIGYTYDKKYEINKLYESSGKIEKIKSSYLGYDMETTDGMCGSGIITKYDDAFYCVGIHSFSGATKNRGVGINTQNFYQIRNWIKELDSIHSPDDITSEYLSGIFSLIIPEKKITREYKIERQIQYWQKRLQKSYKSSAKKHKKILEKEHAFNVIKELENEFFIIKKHSKRKNTRILNNSKNLEDIQSQINISILEEQEQLHKNKTKEETELSLSKIITSKENDEKGVYVSPPPVKILSIDGGGIRGYMPALWLDYIATNTRKEVYQLFDIMGGTSIGGILALGLATPRENVTTSLVNLFEIHRNEIFPKNHGWFPEFLYKGMSFFRSSYYEDDFEKLLKNYFQDKTLGDLQSRVVVTTFHVETQEPFFFKSYEEKLKYCKLWEVARATSAAPTYFKPHTMKFPNEDTSHTFLDGGIYSNNPAEKILTEAFLYNNSINKEIHNKNIIMISLGSGELPMNVVTSNVGVVNSVAPLINNLMNINSIGTHEALQNLLSDNYLRINPFLERKIELDDTSLSNMEYLKSIAETQYSIIDESIENGQIRKILEAQ